MDDDQQFCLRWNNHQSTLVSVFDNLLENGTLVDCTLFAEGKFLKAHKVVLSACSPYFESLLTQEYDKHPIFILKDVKFQELKAMMDYMYRGEVNISQDQLAALLKAAESLQIKGLSDSRSKENDTRKQAAAAPPPPPPAAKTPPPAPTLPRVQGLTIEQRKTPKLCANVEVLDESRSRDGSVSPVPRKRKKPRRRTSQDCINDNHDTHDTHDASSSSESHSNPAATASASASAQNIPSTLLPAVPLASTSKLTDVPDHQLDSKSEIITRQMKPQSSSSTTTTTSSSSLLPQCSVTDSVPQVPIKEKLETHSELILEPKSEYIEEEMNEDSVEDLTLEDDDDISQMEQDMDHARPGPSHGSTDGSQGFGGWHMSGNQAQDEVFLAAQEAVGAHRDSQEYLDQLLSGNETLRALLTCPVPMAGGQEAIQFFDTARQYISYSSLVNDSQAAAQPGYSSESQFACRRCGKRYRWKSTMRRHEQVECGGKEPSYQCPHCPYKAKQKGNLGVHVRKHHMKENAKVKNEVKKKHEK